MAFNRIWLLCLALFVLSSVAAEAQAAFVLRLEHLESSTGVVVSDNGLGDEDPAIGGIAVSGSTLPGFIFNIASGVSQPPLPGANVLLELTSISLKSAGAGTLRLTLERDGYVLAGASTLEGSLTGSLAGPSGTTAAFQSWGNASNLVPALGPDTFPIAGLGPIGGTPAGSTPVFSPDPLTFTPGATNADNSVAFAPGGAFSLFSQATIHFAGSGSASFSEAQTVPAAVPEPASLAVWGLGAGFVAIAARFRRRRSAKSA